jgi:hypothetical protein
LGYAGGILVSLAHSISSYILVLKDQGHIVFGLLGCLFAKTLMFAIRLSYFRCMFLLTRPFYWDLNFWPRALDLGVEDDEHLWNLLPSEAFVFHKHILFSFKID